MVQFSTSPLTKPATMTNSRTSTLTAVKTLLTDADSFTPKDKSPVRGKRQITGHLPICLRIGVRASGCRTKVGLELSMFVQSLTISTDSVGRFSVA